MRHESRARNTVGAGRIRQCVATTCSRVRRAEEFRRARKREPVAYGNCGPSAFPRVTQGIEFMDAYRPPLFAARATHHFERKARNARQLPERHAGCVSITRC